jgi:hypothetical protein
VGVGALNLTDEEKKALDGGEQAEGDEEIADLE